MRNLSFRLRKDFRRSRSVVREPVVLVRILVAMKVLSGLPFRDPVAFTQRFVVSLKRVRLNQVAPCALIRSFRSLLAFPGTTMVTGTCIIAPSIAYAMPAFPELESRTIGPCQSCPPAMPREAFSEPADLSGFRPDWHTRPLHTRALRETLP